MSRYFEDPPRRLTGPDVIRNDHRINVRPESKLVNFPGLLGHGSVSDQTDSAPSLTCRAQCRKVVSFHGHEAYMVKQQCLYQSVIALADAKSVLHFLSQDRSGRVAVAIRRDQPLGIVWCASKALDKAPGPATKGRRPVDQSVIQIDKKQHALSLRRVGASERWREGDVW